ncbi:MAG TPA: energy transducer TonB [Puia sp.]|jgi:protein TonB|nr:energy transducer TonB [Puia sp.]
MNTESILHANVLDIIFENRNKEYGAYELRTRYDKRLKNATIIMISTVAIFCSAIYIDGHFFHHQLSKMINYEISDPSVAKINESKPQELIKPKTAQPIKQQIATVKDVTFRIVRNEPTKPLPTVTDIDSKQIGPQDKPSELAGDIIPVSSTENKKGNSTETKTETAEREILVRAEFMPEFPGGEAALQRFLSKNIRMPIDLEPGTKIKVMAKFVVDENGNISAMQTVQSGSIEFDNEVLRVLKKMPQWKPGRQNGRSVAVYFNLPVIFLSQDDN